MDWKLMLAVLGGAALIFAALSLGDKGPRFKGPREARQECIVTLKDRPVAEIERICGMRSWYE